MKIRSIHPGFFSDSKVCSLSYPARILWQGLWCFADDYGMGPWIPKSIEGAVFPRDEVDINALMFEVTDQGLVELYGVDGDTFYRIPNWDDYQKPRYVGKRSTPDPTKVKKARKINPVEVLPENCTESARKSADICTESARKGQGEREREREREREEEREREAEREGSLRGGSRLANQKPAGTTQAEWAAALSLANERGTDTPERLATYLLAQPDTLDQIRQRMIRSTPMASNVRDLLDGIAKEAS